MTRFLLPILLIAISITGFMTFTNPIYQDIKTIQADSASYDQALNNSKALESERDKLTQKYNSISGQNLDRLQKLLPEHVDNIRLILEIEKVALPYGMALKDVKYDTTKEEDTKPNSGVTGGNTLASRKDYGVWTLEFSTEGTYQNLVKFIKDIEKNLRIVDIVSVEFDSSSPTSTAKDVYKYKFTIKTYWLKN